MATLGALIKWVRSKRGFSLKDLPASFLGSFQQRVKFSEASPQTHEACTAVSGQLSASAASRNRKGSVCQPTSEPRPMLCLYRSCLHKPASATPRESPALMRHNGPRSARYFGLGRALQGNRRPLGPCVAARHWPRGAHTRGVHAKGNVYAISKT